MLNNMMNKKIFYYEILQDKLDSNQEKNLLLLYPKYVANFSVFIEKENECDNFFLINEINILNDFSNEIKKLNIPFLVEDQTNSLLSGESSNLEVDTLNKINKIYFK